MADGRKALPRPTERDVLVEAGHRCAIPTCRDRHPEVHHITPVKAGGSDDFENLIALCPNCHGMADRGEIDRKAVRQYKANLSVLNHRYSSMERRVLDYLAITGESSIDIPAGMDILLWCLVEDGYLTAPRDIARRHITVRDDYYDPEPGTIYRLSLTEEGRAFIESVLGAEDIE